MTDTPDYGSHFSCKLSNKPDAITFTFYVEKCKNSTTELV